MPTSEPSGDEVVRRLDILIRLVAAAISQEDWPQKKKIAMLSAAGLSTKEIADFLGTTPGTVSVAVSNMRKDKGTKRRAQTESTHE